MSEENLNKKFEEEFNKLSKKDKREINNLIRFMQEKKYHDSQYEELLNQYIELSRDYDKLENIINEFEDFITNVDSHINLGDESEEFILVRDKWLELQELKGVDKE